MIGLIVNPVSSKDIRRLVALGRVVPVEEKANLVARFLAGVAGGIATEVRALDDAAGVARRAERTAGTERIDLSWLPVDATGTETDTVAAAARLRKEGADLVAVVGGDGTLRAAVEGWPDMPVVLLPAGTNNAFSSPVEPTVTGLAATHVADPAVRAVALTTRSRLVVETPGGPVTAVVDAVGVSDRWVASRALWRPSDLIEAVVTRADPASIGVASIAAAFGPLVEGRVRHLRFGTGETITAVFGPGLVLELAVTHIADLEREARVEMDARTGVVAVDGERRVLGDRSSIVARPGPAAFDPGAALAHVTATSRPGRDLLP